MNKYARGQIYHITHDEITFYVGSTTLSRLQTRFGKHLEKAADPTITSDIYVAMREKGIQNFRISLIKKFPCNSKKELEAEEYRIIDEYIANGVPLYNQIINGKHSAKTKAKMALAKIGNKNAFKCGSVFECKSKTQHDWRFVHSENKKQQVRSFSIARYGFWGAKKRAEAERLAKFPTWVKDPQEDAIEGLMRMEI